MRYFVLGLLVAVAGLLSVGLAWSQQSPLPADQAFGLAVERGQDGGLSVSWAIEEGYYLYRDKISAALVETGGEQPLPLETAPGEPYSDPYFGNTEISHAAASRALMQAFDVVGPPTLLFLDPNAREVADTRLIGSIDVDGFLARLDTVPGA